MPDTHDERGGDAAMEVACYADQYVAYADGDSDAAPGRPPIEAMRRVREQLAAATARAKKAEALNRDLARSTMLHMEKLGAERDEAKLRAEKAEARLAELGEPEVEQRIVGVNGTSHVATDWDLANRDLWAPGVRLEERQVYPTPWRVACRSCGTTERVLGNPPLCSNCAVYAPASFTGLLAAPRLAADAAPDGRSASETGGDGVQGSDSVSTPVRAAAGLPEACGHKLDYHVCFLPAGHDGDHRDSLNWTWMTHLGTWPNDDDTTEDDRG